MRLSTILSSLYSPRIEQIFLQSASHLLLALAAKSADFERPVFDAPLTAGSWQVQNIDPSWRHPLFATPLFAATQLTGATIGTQGPGSMAPGRLRATQDLLYSQTQTQNPGANVGACVSLVLCIISSLKFVCVCVWGSVDIVDQGSCCNVPTPGWCCQHCRRDPNAAVSGTISCNSTRSPILLTSLFHLCCCFFLL